MQLNLLLPAPCALTWGEVSITPERIAIFVRSALSSGACPQCGFHSSRVHSHYQRTLADLPWQGTPTRLYWLSRKFFCDNLSCPQRIFTERLPKVAVSYGRKTCRMADMLCAVGFACGGEGGARLTAQLAMPTSADTLLRDMRRTLLPVTETPRVLGVDDWAFLRGQRYGTILCDLERHRPVDLLPERSSETLAEWLKAHPGVEIISRDRADCYINGAKTGAPQALQVADRWHLLKNLREMLIRVADRCHKKVQAAAGAVIENDKIGDRVPAKKEPRGIPPPDIVATKYEQRKQQRRARRMKRYRRVVKLHALGFSKREIARRMGMQFVTVSRFLAAGCFPERAQQRYPRATDPFIDYLRRRWKEGCHNASQLTSELKQQGFKGSYEMVRCRVADWRKCSRCDKGKKYTGKRSRLPVKRLSSNRIAWLLLKPLSDMTLKESSLVTAIIKRCPALEKAAVLAREFMDMVRNRKAEILDDWITRACAPEGAVELNRFANGLLSDLPAIRAALSLSWSNGQVEGQVNRLKLIKRQMYGRAKFDLLRQRVLYKS